MEGERKHLLFGIFTANLSVGKSEGLPPCGLHRPRGAAFAPTEADAVPVCQSPWALEFVLHIPGVKITATSACPI